MGREPILGRGSVLALIPRWEVNLRRNLCGWVPLNVCSDCSPGRSPRGDRTSGSGQSSLALIIRDMWATRQGCGRSRLYQGKQKGLFGYEAGSTTWSELRMKPPKGCVQELGFGLARGAEAGQAGDRAGTCPGMLEAHLVCQHTPLSAQRKSTAWRWVKKEIVP